MHVTFLHLFCPILTTGCTGGGGEMGLKGSPYVPVLLSVSDLQKRTKGKARGITL